MGKRGPRGTREKAKTTRGLRREKKKMKTDYNGDDFQYIYRYTYTVLTSRNRPHHEVGHSSIRDTSSRALCTPKIRIPLFFRAASCERCHAFERYHPSLHYIDFDV